MEGIRNLVEKCKDTNFVLSMMDQLGLTQADIVQELGFSRSVTSKIMASQQITSPAQRAALGVYFALKLLGQIKEKYTAV